jgi:hypothetical protein
MDKYKQLIAIASFFTTAALAAPQWQALPQKAPAPADNPTTPEPEV